MTSRAERDRKQIRSKRREESVAFTSSVAKYNINIRNYIPYFLFLFNLMFEEFRERFVLMFRVYGMLL